MKNLGILLSGRGSNFEAIAKNVACWQNPRRPHRRRHLEQAGCRRNRNRPRIGLDAMVIPSKGKPREEHDREVVAALQQHKVDLVCLAGYMRLLSPWFVQQFPRRILNIHPSLLPSFPGLEAQEQAFAYGVKVTGCTVHFVDEELDHGAIIVQKAIPVLDTDDEHTLAARILEQEHVAYSEAINIVWPEVTRSRGEGCKSKNAEVGMQKSGHSTSAETGTKYGIVTVVTSKLPCVRNAARMSGVKDLKIRTKEFAIRIMKLYRSLPAGEECRVLGKQLLRSGTSVGANYRAACRARSKAEFVAKMGIVLEEVDETAFWLELLIDGGLMSEDKLRNLLQEANELSSIFVASLRTAKGISS